MSIENEQEIRDKIFNTNPGDRIAARSYQNYLNERRSQDLDNVQNLARDINELPEVADPERLEACRLNFMKFAVTYFPELFYLKFSPDQDKVIAAIQAAVLQGAWQAIALPRASGKTTLCEVACIWALIYSHKEFVLLVGATSTSAKESLENIRMLIEHNAILRSDWPLLDRALEMADGSAVKASRITYQGNPINFTYKTTELTLPRSAASAGAGASLAIAGVEGRIRGIKKQTVDGRNIRPDLVLVDDIQTRATAESPSKVYKRERIIKADIMGLSGPDKSISGLIACTVIKPDDLADRLLDRDLNPQFRGVRGKLLYKMPDNLELWEKYFDIRANCMLDHGHNKTGTSFYNDNREAMDKGSRVAWDERKKEGQLSGLQYAMDLLQDDKQAFYSEYQNQPLDDSTDKGNDYLTPVHVRSKATRNDVRGKLPEKFTKLTAFIDVQQELLYYMVIGWREDTFAGHIVDYGSYPEQNSLMYKAQKAPVPFSKYYPKRTIQGAMYEGLNTLVNTLFSWDWITADEQHVRLTRALIDANFNKSTETVYQFCRQSIYSALIDPSHGKYFGAASTPMNQQKKNKGEKRGHNWVMPSPKNNRKRRYVIYDTNYWKSFVTDRLKLSLGDPGTISIFGDPERHEMLAQHLTSEVSILTSGKGRELEEWKVRRPGVENHWFDCLVGAAVAASIEGLKTDAETMQEETKRKRLIHGRLRTR